MRASTPTAEIRRTYRGPLVLLCTMRPVLFAIVLLCATASSASAHVEILSPTPRYTLAETSGGANKACPCGAGLSNRLCNVDGDRNDSNRAAPAKITALISGETLTLRFDEYVGHTGRYRVAIDYNGADLADFNANILVDMEDPAGSAGNIGDGSIWEISVPLPDFSCDNCTLQLIQVMDGNTTDPVPDPIGRSSYYACTDIVLTGGDAYPPGQDNLSVEPGAPDAGPGGNTGGDDDAGGGNGGGNGGNGGGVQGGCQTAPSSTWLAAFGILLVLGLGRRRRSL